MVDGKEIKPGKIEESMAKIFEKLEILEKTMNERFERMKKVIGQYLKLGSDFALGAVDTALQQV